MLPRSRAQALPLALVGAIFFFALAGIAAAAEESVKVQQPPGGVSLVMTKGTTYETGANAEAVGITIICEAETTGAHVGTVTVTEGTGSSVFQPTFTTEGKEHPETITTTLIIAGSTKYKWTVSPESACGKSEGKRTTQTLTYNNTGATGPAGPTGPAGSTGPEGKEGKEGKEGGGQLTSFGGPAENTLNELKESGEVIGWCVIGTLIALAIGFAVWKILQATRV